MTRFVLTRSLLCLLGCMFWGPVFSSVEGPAAEACAIGEGRWGGGTPVDGERWSDVSEDLLLIGAGAELVLFDISTPNTPVELGRALVNHPAISVAVSPDGQMAAVSDWADNVTLVDISTRNAPVARGTYAWAGIEQPTGMEFAGDYLYVAVRQLGLTVLDITNPDVPAFVANSDGSPTDFVLDVVLRGDYAYLGQDADGVEIVDISDPGNPTVAGNYAGSTGAGQLTLDGSRLIVARGGGGFDMLSLTNPIVPSLVGTADETLGFLYEAVVMPGNRLAVADNIDGTVVFDISTPATPVELGSYGNSPFRLVALGNLVFTVHGSTGTPVVRLVDFSTPASASEVAHIDFNGLSRDVSMGPGHVLVANSQGGVVMLDITNPVDPSVVGSLDVGFDVSHVGHVNGYGVASIGYAGDIAVVDPQPGGPTLVHTFDNTNQTNDLIGVGTLLYVASGQFGGLRIHDLANPMAPSLVGSLVPAGETVWQIDVAGDFLYSGYVNDTDLLVIDVSTPGTPATIGSPYVLPGGAVDIAASGANVYVATQVHGVRVLQNDGAGVLTEIADIDLGLASPTGVAVDGDLLYISAGTFSGLLIYDVADPSNPMPVEVHNTAGDGQAVDGMGGVIAMAEWNTGVSTFGCDLAAINQPPETVGVIGDQNNDEGTMIFPLSTNPNFNDPDGQALKYSATGLPPGLDIGLETGVVQGALDYLSSGVYPVVITATDPFDEFVTQSFTWTVNNVNAPPESLSEIPDQENDEGDMVNLDVSTYFTDIDGEDLHFDAGNLPAGLELDEPSGVISGTLTANSSGSYPVLILAYDPDEAFTGQTITWTVNNTIVTLNIFIDGFEGN